MTDEIEKIAGRRPSDRDVKEELARATMLGRLRYQKGYGKLTAGYFPSDYRLQRQAIDANCGFLLRRAAFPFGTSGVAATTSRAHASRATATITVS
jgi:hypothetical protein